MNAEVARYVDQMMGSYSDQLTRINAILDEMEPRLTDEIETLSYEFVPSPEYLDDDIESPEEAMALEVQAAFLSRILHERFSLFTKRCIGGWEAHAAHIAINGECPWCLHCCKEDD